MKTKSITIPLSEYDLEVFKGIMYGGGTVEWTFPTDGADENSEEIEIRFVQED